MHFGCKLLFQTPSNGVHCTPSVITATAVMTKNIAMVAHTKDLTILWVIDNILKMNRHIDVLAQNTAISFAISTNVDHLMTCDI